MTETGGGTRYVYAFPERPPRLNVEHDREKGVFRVAQPDGTTDVFRDEPIRFLVATRNPRTGETMPMLRYGELGVLVLVPGRKETEVMATFSAPILTSERTEAEYRQSKRPIFVSLRVFVVDWPLVLNDSVRLPDASDPAILDLLAAQALQRVTKLDSYGQLRQH